MAKFEVVNGITDEQDVASKDIETLMGIVHASNNLLQLHPAIKNYVTTNVSYDDERGVTHTAEVTVRKPGGYTPTQMYEQAQAFINEITVISNEFPQMGGSITLGRILALVEEYNKD